MHSIAPAVCQQRRTDQVFIAACVQQIFQSGACSQPGHWQVLRLFASSGRPGCAELDLETFVPSGRPFKSSGIALARFVLVGPVVSRDIARLNGPGPVYLSFCVV